MSVAEIKSNIIDKITSIEDLMMLKKITELLGINLPEKEVYVFTNEQQKRINLALKQVENGEFISHEEAEKEIQEWFKNQD